MKTTFQQLGLGSEILRALNENGFEAPFPIQEAAIPFILKGMDVVGQAHTGTGKTAAFSLPLLTKIKYDGPGTSANTCANKRTSSPSNKRDQ